MQVTKTYHRVPRARAQADTVVANAQTADTVLVTYEGSDLLSSGDIPYLKTVSQSSLIVAE